MADTSYHDHFVENPVQFIARSIAGVVVDVDESHVYGFVLFDVSLG